MARPTTLNNSTLLELKAKLEIGTAQAERGELIDGVQVFDELREMIEERRLAKAVRSAT